MKILFLLAGTLFAGQISYLDVLDKLNSPKGSNSQGEIEIVTSPSQIEEIEMIQKNRLLKKGYSEKEAISYSKVGVIAEDQYWIWIRDAVLFPGGVPGTYNRLIWRSRLDSPYAGVAVLPVLPDGRIVLNLNYRHATRSWEFELPRGVKKAAETCEEAALRELREETGLKSTSLQLLGEIAPDSGVMGSVVPVYIGFGSTEGLSNPEYSEAIQETLAFSAEEIRQGFAQGYLIIRGEKIPLRDPFLAYALLKKELLGF